MNRLNRFYIAGILVALLTTALITGCKTTTTAKFNNMVGDKEKQEVIDTLKENNIDYKVFLESVEEFNNAVGDSGVLVKDWTSISKRKINDNIIQDHWEKSITDRHDINCRITAFSLISPLISLTPNGETKAISDESYLQDEIETIKKTPRLEGVSQDLNKFYQIFGEIKISDLGDGKPTDEQIAKAYPDQWAKRGVVFPEGNVSLVTIVQKFMDNQYLIVGHTGVLIKTEKGYLYIEKITPYATYDIIRYKSLEELKNDMLGRKEFYTETKDNPLIYINNSNIDTLDLK